MSQAIICVYTLFRHNCYNWCQDNKLLLVKMNIICLWIQEKIHFIYTQIITWIYCNYLYVFTFSRLYRYANFNIVELGSCSSLLKSRNSALKVSIQIWKEQSWRYNHSAPPPPPTTNNFKKPLEWWFSLYFSSQTKLKIFSISNFQFLKFQDSWQLEIL